jgi:serine phosphatase RsbU (regulator of sigma subunit)
VEAQSPIEEDPMSQVRPVRSPRPSALQAELADLHRAALPRLERIPEGFDLACWARPARTIGGDLVAAWPLGETRLFVFLADVMGHDLPAAIVASAVRTALYQQELAGHTRPAHLLAGLNRLIAGMFEGYFVTASACLLDAAAGTLTFAQAGNPPLLLRHRDGEVTPIFMPALPLGLAANEPYQEQTLPLTPGAAVILYSDGVSDALIGPETSGTETLSSVVARCRRPSAFRLVQRIRRIVHRSSPIRHDDRSVLAVRLLPDRD